MKTKIGFLKFAIPAAMGLGMIFSSCLKDDNHYSMDDFAVSLGTIEKKTTGTSDYVIHLDDGSQVVPLSMDAPPVTITDNQRVMVNYSIFRYEPLTDSTRTYYANIDGLRDILFKGIKKYTEVRDDSMGHDPIIIRDAWISKVGGILNVDLKYYTQGSVHYINLIDNGEGNGIDQPFVLELRHNARGDRKDYPATGYVSFKLDYLKLTGKTQTKFFIRYTDYDGRRIDLPRTYNY